MIAPASAGSSARREAGLHLEFTCSPRCDAPRAVRLLVEQVGGRLAVLQACGKNRTEIIYRLNIVPGSLDAACTIIEQLGEFGAVSFIPYPKN